jgi:hypothetical protein
MAEKKITFVTPGATVTAMRVDSESNVTLPGGTKTAVANLAPGDVICQFGDGSGLITIESIEDVT